MRRLAAFLAACAFGTALAADPARLAEARSMMRALDFEKQMDAMMGAMSQAMARQMNDMSGGRNPAVARIAMEEGMRAAREQVMRPGGMLDTVSEAYAEEFTLEELRQIRAFHESPVGRRLLESSPRIMQRVMEKSALGNPELFTRVCERVNQRLVAEKLATPDRVMKCPPPRP